MYCGWRAVRAVDVRYDAVKTLVVSLGRQDVG